jgi:uncharacterized membrane protein YkvA (DUF1232 family)
MSSTSRFGSKGKRRRRKGTLLRSLRWLAFLPVAGRVPMYARLIWTLALDERVPASRKAILVGAAGYVFVGRDVIRDRIPVLGGIDDLAVVVLAVEVFFDGIPDALLEEKLDELGMDQDLFRRDIDQVRRLTPMPVRRIMHRLPDAIDAAGQLITKSKIGPRVRSWIVKEESFA